MAKPNRPFFARFLEDQDLSRVAAGKKNKNKNKRPRGTDPRTTLRYPSDSDEAEATTKRYPSDSDEV